MSIPLQGAETSENSDYRLVFPSETAAAQPPPHWLQERSALHLLPIREGKALIALPSGHDGIIDTGVCGMQIEVLAADGTTCGCVTASPGHFSGALGHALATARHALRQYQGVLAWDAMSPKVTIDRQRVADFCRRHHIRRLALFGSVLRDDFGPNSDVDILVEFDPGHVPGFALVNLEDELSALVGRKVDLHTPGSLSKYFRDRVVREAQDQYVAA